MFARVTEQLLGISLLSVSSVLVSLPATHTPVKVTFSHLTPRWYLRILSIINSWDRPATISQREDALFRILVCVCLCVCARIFKHVGSALVFVVLHYRVGC